MAAATGCCLFGTAIGRCGIAWTAEGAIQAVQLPETSDARTLLRMRRRCGEEVPEGDAPEAVAQVIARLQRLLEGDRDALLDVAIDYEGVPPFHQRVYEAARAIVPGRVKTYGELARELGDRAGGAQPGRPGPVRLRTGFPA